MGEVLQQDTIKAGDIVRVLPAYSMETHRSDRHDHVTGMRMQVIRVVGRFADLATEHGAEWNILVSRLALIYRPSGGEDTLPEGQAARLCSHAAWR